MHTWGYEAATAAEDQDNDPTGADAVRRYGIKKARIQGVRIDETCIYMKSCFTDPHGGEFDIVYQFMLKRLGFDTWWAMSIAIIFAIISLLSCYSYWHCDSLKAGANSCRSAMELCAVTFAIFPCIVIAVYSILFFRWLIILVHKLFRSVGKCIQQLCFILRKTCFFSRSNSQDEWDKIRNEETEELQAEERTS